jgi:hypothetical protein
MWHSGTSATPRDRSHSVSPCSCQKNRKPLNCRRMSEELKQKGTFKAQ